MTGLLTIVLFGCLATIHCSRVIGRFGKQVFHADVEFDADHDMIVTFTSPADVHPTYRETENLHIFPTHHVAARNSKDKQCYVRHFLESIDRIIGRVENAIYNNGEINNFMIQRFDLTQLKPLDAKTVENILGHKIANFCTGHDVYFISAKEISSLDPHKAGAHVRRGRNFLNGIKLPDIVTSPALCGIVNPLTPLNYNLTSILG